MYLLHKLLWIYVYITVKKFVMLIRDPVFPFLSYLLGSEEEAEEKQDSEKPLLEL